VQHIDPALITANLPATEFDTHRRIPPRIAGLY